MFFFLNIPVRNDQDTDSRIAILWQSKSFGELVYDCRKRLVNVHCIGKTQYILNTLSEL